MATENKFDKLRSMVHQGVPLEKPVQKIGQDKKESESVTVEAKVEVDAPAVTGTVMKTGTITETAITPQVVEPAEKEVKESVEPVIAVSEPAKTTESTSKPVEKRRQTTKACYFTHRKPLYITAVTHRRLMRIVHLMDESKATISSYVENIILNHLDMFREEIDTIYQTNNINPVE